MAKKSKKQIDYESKIAKINEEDLLSFTKRSMIEYGKYTLESRAIPDFRDGFKPVQRRILWAAQQLGMTYEKGLLKKSARLIGDVLGKYHPHGDTACYDATVTMVHLKNPCIFGSGNWGTITESAAAMRYTECMLSKYSDKVFFDKAYLPVTETVHNFDNTEKEPVILNALLPNLILNGSFGIATGGRCSIPAFEPEGVIKLLRKQISGSDITVKDCTKYLVPASADGGLPYLDEKEYVDELARFYKTGLGSVYWVPDAEYDLEERCIIISGFAPKVTGSLENTLKKIAQLDYVDEIHDSTDINPETGKPDITYRIYIKKSIAKKEVEYYLDEIHGYFESSQNLVFSVTTRSKKDDYVDTTFEIINMPDFFKRWCEYRVDLEKRSINYLLSIQNSKLERAELLLLAVLNRELIIKALDSEDTESFLMKKLKITKEQANAILELKVKQLKRLEEKPLRQQIKDYQKEIKSLKADYKNPTNRILETLDLSKYDL